MNFIFCFEKTEFKNGHLKGYYNAPINLEKVISFRSSKMNNGYNEYPQIRFDTEKEIYTWTFDPDEHKLRDQVYKRICDVICSINF